MSGKPVQGRMTADGTGEVVVFLIGMRINNWRAVRSWLPVLRAMPPMMKELVQDPERGLLGYRPLPGLREFGVVQYWESKEKLLAYASDRSGAHRPAWAAFNRRAREGRGHVGIWHETYVVPAGSYETIYANMPPRGLGAARGVVPVARRGERAAERLAA
ncbi:MULTISPECIES: DUF4188 domain-containing protein [Streptomyces]|uniref:DUF4188 domain-containing protein n=1 Tax=Streptomyces siderophoricus TaxID=2802281 RepID=A0ABS1MYP1_9ACTN|nr:MULTISPECIES: DUF4188 domain-containing protein [unclassified Streptomyces]MBL1092903.1 DUF4188 domain-containing protein [Streptomyces sp. 9-7]